MSHKFGTIRVSGRMSDLPPKAGLSRAGRYVRWGSKTEAVAAYRAALIELNRTRVPLEWARTQNKLSAALEALSKR